MNTYVYAIRTESGFIIKYYLININKSLAIEVKKNKKN